VLAACSMRFTPVASLTEKLTPPILNHNSLN
jgi:hypothetical protein